MDHCEPYHNEGGLSSPTSKLSLTCGAFIQEDNEPSFEVDASEGSFVSAASRAAPAASVVSDTEYASIADEPADQLPEASHSLVGQVMSSSFSPETCYDCRCGLCAVVTLDGACNCLHASQDMQTKSVEQAHHRNYIKDQRSAGFCRITVA